MELIPKDTTPEAYRYQIEVLRKLGPEGRLKLCMEASDNLRQLVAVGVKLRHPDYTEEEVRSAVTRLIVGEDVFIQAFPWIQIKP